MAATQTHTAEIEVDRNDARADHENFDEYDVIIRNPVGEFPAGMYGEVSEHVREAVDLSQLSDGERLRVGTVTYDADSVLEIAVADAHE